MKIGEMTLNEARQAFLGDLVRSLAEGTDADDLLTTAAINGFAEEVRNAVISDISARFLDLELADWSAVLTVRTVNLEHLASGALHTPSSGSSAR